MTAEPSDPNSKVDIERRRVPLQRKISLKFKEFRGFITEYSSNLSMGGMFIRTSSPKPVGTIFDFELSLTDDFKLVQGIGEVIWVRETDDGPERPCGMGVRFLDLSRDSRRLIQRIIEEHIAHGGTPFELEPPGFPPPPLKTAAAAGSPSPKAAPQSALFHPTAAPVSAAPPPPRPPARSAATPTRPPAEGAAPAVPGAPRTAAGPAPPARPAPRPPAQSTARTAPPPAAVPSPPSRDHRFADAPPAAGGTPRADVLPDLDEAWEGEALEGFRLEDSEHPPESPGVLVEPLDEAGARSDVHDEPTLLKGFRPPATEGGATTSSAWVAPPAPSSFGPPPAGAPRGRGLPTGFDEVARAFSESGSTAEPQAEPSRRGPLVVPPAPVSALAVPPPIPEPGARPGPRPPFAAHTRRAVARRRSWTPLVAALVLLVAAGVGVVYLWYPQVLPDWARPPRLPEPAGGSTAGNAGPRTTTQRGPRPSPGGGDATAGTGTADPATGDGTAGTSAAPQAAAGGAATRTAPTVPPGSRPLPGGAGVDIGGVLPRGGSAPTARFSSVEEIWGQRSGPGTLVTIVTNGSVPPDAYSHFRLEGASPREVVRLRGVDDSYRRASIPIATGEVKQVRLGYHTQPGGNELHIVVDLNSPRVGLLQIRPVDNRLELLFALQQ